jgi:hypothetical protein
MKYLPLLFLLFAFPAEAQHSFEFRFTEPTERTDGQPFNPSLEAAGYRAQCARDSSFTSPAEIYFTRTETLPDGNGRYFLWEGAVQVGGWYFCRLNLADTDGLVSDWSVVVSVRKQANPKPPTPR